MIMQCIIFLLFTISIWKYRKYSIEIGLNKHLSVPLSCHAKTLGYHWSMTLRPGISSHWPGIGQPLRPMVLALGRHWACIGQALARHWLGIGQALGSHRAQGCWHWACIGKALARHWAAIEPKDVGIGHALARHWPTVGQALTRHWPGIGTALAKHRPFILAVISQVLARHWSGIGPLVKSFVVAVEAWASDHQS